MEDTVYSIVTCYGADIPSAQATKLALGHQDAGDIKGQQPTPFLAWQMVGRGRSEQRGRARGEDAIWMSPLLASGGKGPVMSCKRGFN